MPIVRHSDAPIFTPHGATITGLAAPSRGSKEISVWRVRLLAGTTPEHTLDAEEIFAVLDGDATFLLNGVEERVGPGDTIIVDAGDRLSFRVGSGEHLDAICTMRVGAKATMLGQAVPFSPPWTL